MFLPEALNCSTGNSNAFVPYLIINSSHKANDNFKSNEARCSSFSCSGNVDSMSLAHSI